jgi:hypothetical protein
MQAAGLLQSAGLLRWLVTPTLFLLGLFELLGLRSPAFRPLVTPSSPSAPPRISQSTLASSWSTASPTASASSTGSTTQSLSQPPMPSLPPPSQLYRCALPLPGERGAVCGGVNATALEAYLDSFFSFPDGQAYALATPAFETGFPHSTSGVAAGSKPPCYALGVKHTITLRTANADAACPPPSAGGCRGGDYLEALLQSPRLRYRPRTTDFGNGTYTLDILLPDDELLAEEQVTLSVHHLFRAHAGLAYYPDWGRGIVDAQ